MWFRKNIGEKNDCGVIVIVLYLCTAPKAWWFWNGDINFKLRVWCFWKKQITPIKSNITPTFVGKYGELQNVNLTNLGTKCYWGNAQLVLTSSDFFFASRTCWLFLFITCCSCGDGARCISFLLRCCFLLWRWWIRFLLAH